MKKFMVLVLVVVMAICVAGVASAGERLLPDTSQIIAGKHFEVLGTGQEVMPVWEIKNPTCYNRQDIKLGTIETWVDNNSNKVYVLQNGKVTKVYKIKYNASIDFVYPTN